MSKELKKRIITGSALLLLLSIMLFSKTVYLFACLIIYAFSFIEFTNITKRIFKYKNFKKLIFNLLFLLHLSVILIIFIIGINDIHFRLILFIILLICIASDIGGITFGKIIKGPKLTKISPNKTLSGSLGSFIFSVLISLILLDFTFNSNIITNVFFGLLISFSVQLGDLLISSLKRKAFIKNTGNILPGHGGVLDRIDGIIFGLPIGLIFVLILLS